MGAVGDRALCVHRNVGCPRVALVFGGVMIEVNFRCLSGDHGALLSVR
ncbi:Uncharacterised protein [Mycobacteroides abscessus subsp. abscessus]|nr:Uncharacterised protein [Mycobacteroides abscessus subsp. abscessus]